MTEDPTSFTDEPVVTGFDQLVTATVTKPEPLTAEGIEAAKALVNLPEKTAVELAQLARDIAYNTLEWPKLLAKHHLTQAQYDWLKEYNEFFKALLSQAISEWHGIKNTQQRLQAQAAAALEEILPVIAGRVAAKSEKLVDVVEGAKLLGTISGAANPNVSRSGGEGFSIQIDLGADTRLTIGHQGVQSAGDEAHPSAPVPKVVEGKANSSAVQPLAKGESNAVAVRPLPARAPA